MAGARSLDHFALPRGEAWRRTLTSGFCPLVALAQQGRGQTQEEVKKRPDARRPLDCGGQGGGIVGAVVWVFLVWLLVWYLWISPVINACACKKYTWAVIVFFTQWLGGLVYRLSGQNCDEGMIANAAAAVC
jgi:hypothetical protein